MCFFGIIPEKFTPKAMIKARCPITAGVTLTGG